MERPVNLVNRKLLAASMEFRYVTFATEPLRRMILSQSELIQHGKCEGRLRVLKRQRFFGRIGSEG